MKNKQPTKQKPEVERSETIEISPDGRQVQAWCKVLKDFGINDCNGDCKNCLCG